MDGSNRKEESEKFIKLEISSTTPTPASTPISLSTHSDNETSTDSSELLASWTLVNDKENSKLKEGTDDHIDILKNSDNEEGDVFEQHNDEDPDKDAVECFEDEEGGTSEPDRHLDDSLNKYPFDDVSDGISVISDSESFDDGVSYRKAQITETELRRRCGNTAELHPREAGLDFVLPSDDTYGPLAPKESLNHTLTKTSTSVLKFSYSMTKRGLSCALYVGVGIALLGFLGNIFNTSWQPFSAVVKTHPSADQLEQKLNEMELQNNLMRAEIDLLNKQVKYLSTLNEGQQEKSTKYKDSNSKGGKSFKVWPGNGDSLKPVDITKQDLKKPYKCPNGSFVEIANMCMEQRSENDPSLVDQFAQMVEKLKEQSEAFTTFEQVAEELHGLPDNPPEEANVYATHIHDKNEEKNNSEYKRFSPKDSSHERKKGKFGRRGSSEIHDDNDDSGEWLEKRMKGREQLRNKNRSNEDDDDDDSGEWHDKYMKHREQQRKKNEYKSGSHERYDSYMKNREQQRKQTEQKNHYNNNGYSRENKQRSGENQYR